MPTLERFERSEQYYATLFHELIHASGHETRLNRSTLTEQAGFGSDPYCREELIAEIGAAFLCGHAEIAERTIDNSAAYVSEWLKRMKDDKKLIVQAAAQAQRAADFILRRGDSKEKRWERMTELEEIGASLDSFSLSVYPAAGLRGRAVERYSIARPDLTLSANEPGTRSHPSD